jgi:phospholipase C
MDGFVRSFADTLSRRGLEDGDPARVMGYYNAADVPVYDHLAREFAVCDRWFSSVPGATWPNRLYAICGGAAGSRDDLPHNLPPLYNQPSFMRHLDAHGITWRWYSFEGAAPRPAPDRYALMLIDEAAARAAARPQGAAINGNPLSRRPATDLQIRFAAAMRELRRRGHPVNHP